MMSRHGNGWRITDKMIIEDVRGRFAAYYKNHSIDIERDMLSENNSFYIQVFSENYGYAVDGWYGDESTTMEEAIQYALEGAQLIKAAQEG
jgi:hypothetical protein